MAKKETKKKETVKKETVKNETVEKENNKKKKETTKKEAVKKDKKNKNKKSFFKDFKAELKRVVWPTKKQLLNSTIAVITIVLVTAAIVFALDFTFEKVEEISITQVKKLQEKVKPEENKEETTENNEEQKSEENKEEKTEENKAENNEENKTETNN